MIFADQDGSGETRFGAWCTADTDRKKVLCLEISEIVLQTMYGAHASLGGVLRAHVETCMHMRFACQVVEGVLRLGEGANPTGSSNADPVIRWSVLQLAKQLAVGHPI